METRLPRKAANRRWRGWHKVKTSSEWDACAWAPTCRPAGVRLLPIQTPGGAKGRVAVEGVHWSSNLAWKVLESSRVVWSTAREGGDKRQLMLNPSMMDAYAGGLNKRSTFYFRRRKIPKCNPRGGGGLYIASVTKDRNKGREGGRKDCSSSHHRRGWWGKEGRGVDSGSNFLFLFLWSYYQTLGRLVHPLCMR